MEDHSDRDKILSLLAEKARIKQAVSEHAGQGFDLIKDTLKQLADELRPRVAEIQKSIPVEYSLKGDAEVEFSLAGDTIVFLLHSNIFTFDPSHEIWKLSYVKEDVSRAFCGQIYVYNFLSDSLKYFRGNDTGYLVARIYINKEGHYFVEGKRQLGFLYNDIANAVFDASQARRVAESAILYCLDFDPFTPPYDQVGVVSVQDVLESSLRSKIATGKRLGFKFQADSDMF
jgi:hypothetical protein